MTNRKAISKAIRQQVYDKCNGHCAYCGKEITIQQMQVDHVLAHNKGGVDEISNYLPACRACNYIKNTMDIETFRKYLLCLPDSLKHNYVSIRNALRFGVLKAHNDSLMFYFEKENIDIKPRRKEISNDYCISVLRDAVMRIELDILHFDVAKQIFMKMFNALRHAEDINSLNVDQTLPPLNKIAFYGEEISQNVEKIREIFRMVIEQEDNK